MNNTPIRTSTNGSGRLFESMRIMHRWCWSSSEGYETPGGGRESCVCSISGRWPCPLSTRTPNFPLTTCSTLHHPTSSSPEKLSTSLHTLCVSAHTLCFSTSHTSPASRLDSSPSLPQYFTGFSLFICTKLCDTLNNTRLDCHYTFSL